MNNVLKLLLSDFIESGESFWELNYSEEGYVSANSCVCSIRQGIKRYGLPITARVDGDKVYLLRAYTEPNELPFKDKAIATQELFDDFLASGDPIRKVDYADRGYVSAISCRSALKGSSAYHNLPIDVHQIHGVVYICRRGNKEAEEQLRLLKISPESEHYSRNTKMKRLFQEFLDSGERIREVNWISSGYKSPSSCCGSLRQAIGCHGVPIRVYQDGHSIYMIRVGE